ncbi:MAG: transporter substrate-binding domain-containing protein [Erysipelotrichales bacterium]|nr:transporter substrate-binding domain-containing protein [Erysipelotrichales bacterium]
MKKLLGLLLVSVMVLTLVGCSNSGGEGDKDVLQQIKDKGKLTVGTSPDFAPSEFYVLDENGEKKIVGSDIALAQAIADAIGVELEIKATDFNGVLANIQSGQVDMGISGFAQTEERKQVMQFSVGYQREEDDGYQGILTTKENAKKYKTLDDFKSANLKIAAQSASIQYEMAQKLTTEKNIKQYGTTDAAALALNSGDVDAMVAASSSAQPMTKTFTNLVMLPKEGFDLDPTKMYSTNVIGFPLGEEYASFIELCNKVIEAARANGDLNKWVEEAKELSAQAVE